MNNIAFNEYSNAFLEVSKMICPNTDFNKISMWKEKQGNNIEVNCVVLGHDSILDAKVIVSKKLHPSKGLQMVAEYYQDGKLIKTSSVWYFAFNWQGLMKTTSVSCVEQITNVANNPIQLDNIIEWLKTNRDKMSHVDTNGFVKLFKQAMQYE